MRQASRMTLLEGRLCLCLCWGLWVVRIAAATHVCRSRCFVHGSDDTRKRQIGIGQCFGRLGETTDGGLNQRHLPILSLSSLRCAQDFPPTELGETNTKASIESGF